MRLLSLTVLALACAGRAHVQVFPQPALEGYVVDEANRPIAGAEVLACAHDGPCDVIERRAELSTDPFARLLRPTERSYRLTTTGADGAWRLDDPRDPRSDNRELRFVITAPGREVTRMAIYDSKQVPAAFALRPAFALDIDARCDGAPCARFAVGGIGAYEVARSHFGRVPASTYKVVIVSDPGRPGELRAEIPIDLRSGPQHVTVALQPAGTGLSIRGSVVTERRGRTTVSADCSDVRRTALVQHDGTFGFADVGPPPCRVEAILVYPPDCVHCDRGKPESQRASQLVDKLPATISLRPR